MHWQSFLTGLFVGCLVPLLLIVLTEFKDWFQLYRKNANNTWYQAASKAAKQIELF